MPSVSLPSFLGVAFVHIFPQVPGTCSFNSGSLPLALLLAISEPDPLESLFSAVHLGTLHYCHPMAPQHNPENSYSILNIGIPLPHVTHNTASLVFLNFLKVLDLILLPNAVGHFGL